MNANPYDQQIDTVIRLLTGRKVPRESPTFRKSLEWISTYQGDVHYGKKRQLIDVVQQAFDITEAEIYAAISGVEIPGSVNGKLHVITPEHDLAKLLPKGGWFEWWMEHTAKTESPLSYHIFSSLCVLGASLGRRVYKKMGFFNIYPNIAAILVGPPGRVKKTSAVNIARRYIEKAALLPIFAEKITPEKLITNMKVSGQYFLYAPEASVFFGKQKYNEGLTTLMLRLLDSPDSLEVDTVGRGPEVITDVCLSVLAGSTLSLLANSTPGEVTSSGFLSRFIMVVENDTTREYPEPEMGPHEDKLLLQLERMKTFSGEVTFEPAAKKWYEDWYHQRKQRVRTLADETAAEIMERYTDHFMRIVILTHLVQHDNMVLCTSCCETSAKLLDYTEKRLPQTVTALNQCMAAQDTEYVLHALKRLGGATDHSRLLRRVSSRMDAGRFKKNIATLVEQKIIREEKRGALNYYIIVGNKEEEEEHAHHS